MKNILLILMSLIIIALIVYISLNIKCSKVEEQQSKPIASTQKKKTETKDKNSTTNKENYKRKDDNPVYKDVDAYLKSINFNGNVTIYRKRSEEHTSELQSRFDLVCRLLLEKKKK